MDDLIKKLIAKNELSNIDRNVIKIAQIVRSSSIYKGHLFGSHLCSNHMSFWSKEKLEERILSAHFQDLDKKMSST
ncbi:hypothetical protein Ndes2437B_g00600 [Nannochloris sp. 'desiccata']